MQRHYTLLSVGDSYTIGEALPLQHSFPYQTVQLLRKKGYDFSAPEIIAKTGWTTEELQAAIADYTFSVKYDFVTLLVGVNNQYRGHAIILYKEQFEALLIRCLELVGGKKDHLLILSIPDYSVTPFSTDLDVEKISKEIDEYNKLLKALSIQYKVPYLDITEEGRAAKTHPKSIADDGLHPSASEYARWAEKLAGIIGKLLKK
jgi:lysophospholipase L1-like esterase